MMIRARFLAVVLITATALSCGEIATAPPPPPPPSSPPPLPPPPPPVGDRIGVGDTIVGSLQGNSAPAFSFLPNPAGDYAVFFEVRGGVGTLTVSDSVSHQVVASVFDQPGDPGIISVATQDFTHSGVLQLSVRGSGSTDPTDFRFVIYQVNRAPELRPARFRIGDTVSGETLDPGVDVDEFVAGGTTGQELVGWMERGRSFSGILNMVVRDPTTSTALGVVPNFAEDSVPRIGRIQPLPASRDYQFAVPLTRLAGQVQYPGSYRFRFYPINRAPESTSVTISTDTVISEAVDVAGDIDEFTFTATNQAEFNAFVQSAAARPISVVPFGATVGGSAVATVAGDTGMFQHGTGRFMIVTAGGHGVRVYGQDFRDATGPYRLYVYRIDRHPENVPAAIVFNDSITGETIKLPGDIDEFTFSGTAGQEFNVFLQATNPTLPDGVVLSVFAPNNSQVAVTQSLVAGTPLLALSTGRFALPVTGTYKVSVDGSVGPYRLMVYRVDPKPESVPETLAFGDSVMTEAIDVPGDVDEYTVTVPDSSLANIALQLEPGAIRGTVIAHLLRGPSRQEVLTVAGSAAGGADGQSGRFAIGPGSYVVRVENPSGPSPVAAAYKLKFYRFQAGPEHASENIVIGDTIENEAIDVPGDADRYYLDAQAGDHINIALQYTGGAGYGIWAFLSPMVLLAAPSPSSSLDDHQTMRLDIPVTGRYVLNVTAGGSPEVGYGSYRLAVTRTSTAPEQTSPSLVPGDSVTTEPLDPVGDWDEFTVTATPGEDLGLIFQSTATTWYPRIVAFNPGTRDTLAWTVGQFVRFAGPFRVPSGGQVAVAVFEPPNTPGMRECYEITCGGVYHFTGGYDFHVVRVHRAPETVPAAYAIGDTVRGEAIDPIGDFDEFTAGGTPGEVLTLSARLTANPLGGVGLSFEVIDPATGQILTGQNTMLAGAQQQFYAFPSFTVPASGAFLIRIRGTGTFGDDVTTGPYEFFVSR